jgi:hypothetical protein
VQHQYRSRLNARMKLICARWNVNSKLEQFFIISGKYHLSLKKAIKIERSFGEMRTCRAPHTCGRRPGGSGRGLQKE